jgi:hypothetical protein
MEINAADMREHLTVGDEFCEGNELPQKEVKILSMDEWTEIIETMNAMADKIEMQQMELKDKEDANESLRLELDQFKTPSTISDEINLARYKEIAEIK